MIQETNFNEADDSVDIIVESLCRCVCEYDRRRCIDNMNSETAGHPSSGSLVNILG